MNKITAGRIFDFYLKLDDEEQTELILDLLTSSSNKTVQELAKLQYESYNELAENYMRDIIFFDPERDNDFTLETLIKIQAEMKILAEG